MLYEPRESINPRTFALRHVLLEELKLRLRRVAAEGDRLPLVALARMLDVTYDDGTRRYVVTGGAGRRSEIPLADVQLYSPRTDAGTAAWQRDDAILRANRALAARLVDQLLAMPTSHESP